MSSSVIRYLQTPTIFGRIDDERWEEIVHHNLRPREQDEGKTSFWEHSNKQEKRHILAANAARKNNKDRIMAVSLSNQLFEEAWAELLDEPDDKNFSCIAELHRSGLLEDDQTRTRLLEEIRSRFETDAVDDISMSRGKVGELVKDVIEECDHIEWDKAGEWASNLP